MSPPEASCDRQITPPEASCDRKTSPPEKLSLTVIPICLKLKKSSRHGRECDSFSEPLDDPDGVQQPDVCVGRQGGEEGEDGRQEDAGAQQPLATDQLGEAATRSLAQHVAVEEGTENVALPKMWFL